MRTIETMDEINAMKWTPRWIAANAFASLSVAGICVALWTATGPPWVAIAGWVLSTFVCYWIGGTKMVPIPAGPESYLYDRIGRLGLAVFLLAAAVVAAGAADPQVGVPVLLVSFLLTNAMANKAMSARLEAKENPTVGRLLADALISSLHPSDPTSDANTTESAAASTSVSPSGAMDRERQRAIKRATVRAADRAAPVLLFPLPPITLTSDPKADQGTETTLIVTPAPSYPGLPDSSHLFPVPPRKGRDV